MLSRTAESLYWTSRYIERAESIARLLEVAYRMSLMPTAGEGHENEWASILAAAGVSHAFTASGQEPTADAVTEYLIFDPENPSSIRNGIAAARAHPARLSGPEC